MYDKMKFIGERADGKGEISGFFFIWMKRNQKIPMIGEGIKNGSVYGDEVKPETVRPLVAAESKREKLQLQYLRQLICGEMTIANADIDAMFEDWLKDNNHQD